MNPIQLNNKNKGILWLLFSSVSFAMMNVFVRLAGDLPSLQKSFFRNAIALCIAIFILSREKPAINLNLTAKFHVIMRSIFGTIGIFCNFYAVDHLPLSDASMLGKMSPFFAIIFSFFLLKERISLPQFSALFIAFLGVLFVVKPTGMPSEFFPSFIGLLGGLCAGVAYTFVRSLSMQKVPQAFTICFFSAFSCIVTLPYLLFAFIPMSFGQTISLLLAGLMATGGQFGITYAYSYAPAKEISIFDYIQIPFSALLGYLIFSQTVDFWSLIGYGIIFFATFLNFKYNQKSS